MRVPRDYVLGLVISLRTGVADVAALRAKLEAVIVAGVAGISRGKVLIGTNSGGTGVSYALPSVESYTPEAVLSGYTDIYKALKEILVEDPGISLSDLVDLLEWRYSRAPTESRPDFSTANFR